MLAGNKGKEVLGPRGQHFNWQDAKCLEHKKKKKSEFWKKIIMQNTKKVI